MRPTARCPGSRRRRRWDARGSPTRTSWDFHACKQWSRQLRSEERPWALIRRSGPVPTSQFRKTFFFITKRIKIRSFLRLDQYFKFFFAHFWLNSKIPGVMMITCWEFWRHIHVIPATAWKCHKAWRRCEQAPRFAVWRRPGEACRWRTLPPTGSLLRDLLE